MRKKLKVFITIIAIIGALICAFILYIYSPYFPWERNKAKSVAEQYVSETYGVDLESDRVSSDIIMLDGGGYEVYFTDKKGVSYEVHMPYEQKTSYCWCNYEKELFAQEFKEQHEGNIAAFWNEKININLQSVWMRDDQVPVTNGYLNFDRYEKDCRYFMEIELADKEDKVSDAQDIYDTLTYIKEKNLNAHQVYVRYMSSDQHHVRDICFDLTKNDEYNSVDDVKNKIIGKSSEEE